MSTTSPHGDNREHEMGVTGCWMKGSFGLSDMGVPA
jgi:hypothetical protein